MESQNTSSINELAIQTDVDNPQLHGEAAVHDDAEEEESQPQETDNTIMQPLDNPPVQSSSSNDDVTPPQATSNEEAEPSSIEASQPPTALSTFLTQTLETRGDSGCFVPHTDVERDESPMDVIFSQNSENDATNREHEAQLDPEPGALTSSAPHEVRSARTSPLQDLATLMMNPLFIMSALTVSQQARSTNTQSSSVAASGAQQTADTTNQPATITSNPSQYQSATDFIHGSASILQQFSADVPATPPTPPPPPPPPVAAQPAAIEPLDSWPLIDTRAPAAVHVPAVAPVAVRPVDASEDWSALLDAHQAGLSQQSREAAARMFSASLDISPEEQEQIANLISSLRPMSSIITMNNAAAANNTAVVQPLDLSTRSNVGASSVRTGTAIIGPQAPSTDNQQQHRRNTGTNSSIPTLPWTSIFRDIPWPPANNAATTATAAVAPQISPATNRIISAWRPSSSSFKTRPQTSPTDSIKQPIASSHQRSNAASGTHRTASHTENRAKDSYESTQLFGQWRDPFKTDDVIVIGQSRPTPMSINMTSNPFSSCSSGSSTQQSRQHEELQNKINSLTTERNDLKQRLKSRDDELEKQRRRMRELRTDYNAVQTEKNRQQHALQRANKRLDNAQTLQDLAFQLAMENSRQKEEIKLLKLANQRLTKDLDNIFEFYSNPKRAKRKKKNPTVNRRGESTDDTQNEDDLDDDDNDLDLLFGDDDGTDGVDSIGCGGSAGTAVGVSKGTRAPAKPAQEAATCRPQNPVTRDDVGSQITPDDTFHELMDDDGTVTDTAGTNDVPMTTQTQTTSL